MKQRLDQSVFGKGLVASRSQAESYIRLGKVTVNGVIQKKPGYMVVDSDVIQLTQDEQYVSRAGLKLASIATEFKLNFADRIVLDVGSSTGGFTDYALRRGAKKVVAVDVGTHQLHHTLRGNEKIDLREQTDIRNVIDLAPRPDIVVIDVSFISLRMILPHVASLIHKNSVVVAMVKPQFEAESTGVKHKGIIKNEAMRRKILTDFEQWVKEYYFVAAKKDSSVSGEKGNTERFYLLHRI